MDVYYFSEAKQNLVSSLWRKCTSNYALFTVQLVPVSLNPKLPPVSGFGDAQYFSEAVMLVFYLSEGKALGDGGSLFSSLDAWPGCLFSLAGKREVGLG